MAVGKSEFGMGTRLVHLQMVLSDGEESQILTWGQQRWASCDGRGLEGRIDRPGTPRCQKLTRMGIIQGRILESRNHCIGRTRRHCDVQPEYAMKAPFSTAGAAANRSGLGTLVYTVRVGVGWGVWDEGGESHRRRRRLSAAD